MHTMKTTAGGLCSLLQSERRCAGKLLAHFDANYAAAAARTRKHTIEIIHTRNLQSIAFQKHVYVVRFLSVQWHALHLALMT
jgi:hypothetical protein